MSLVRKTPVGTTRFVSRPEPKLHGHTEPRLTNTTDRKIEFFRRFPCTVTREVWRSGDENDHRLRESSRNQSGVGKIA
jgi:hypothetical protein